MPLTMNLCDSERRRLIMWGGSLDHNPVVCTWETRSNTIATISINSTTSTSAPSYSYKFHKPHVLQETPPPTFSRSSNTHNFHRTPQIQLPLVTHALTPSTRSTDTPSHGADASPRPQATTKAREIRSKLANISVRIYRKTNK